MNFSQDIKPLSQKKLFQYISKYQFHPKKKLSQNFLIDQNISSVILKSLDLDNKESVFEIGTGLGSLTLSLIPSVKHVFSIEKDLSLKPLLNDIMSDYKKYVTVIYDDILSFDLSGFLKCKAQEGYKIEKVVGNLPYSISLPLLKMLMEMHAILKMAVVMIQKEVAERMLAQPGNKNYGIISVISQYYSNTKKIHLVKPGVFYPKPEVDSVIIKINFLDKPRILVEDEELFFEIIRAVFQQRRKNIANSLIIYFKDKIDKGKLENKLMKMGYSTDKRGEEFSVQEFARLTGEIKKIIK